MLVVIVAPRIANAMKYVTTMIGAAICGALCFAVWPEMWKTYGIMGGWLTATIVIGICWYMNHWLGVICNPQGKVWVDQGWAVGAAGIAWALFRFHDPATGLTGLISPIKAALPTLALCCIGGVLGGSMASMVKKHMSATAPKETPEEEAANV